MDLSKNARASSGSSISTKQEPGVEAEDIVAGAIKLNVDDDLNEQQEVCNLIIIIVYLFIFFFLIIYRTQMLLKTIMVSNLLNFPFYIALDDIINSSLHNCFY